MSIVDGNPLQMSTGAGIVERNHQDEFGEPVEPHELTADSAVDNKNLEQSSNTTTSSTSEVPQKMKSSEKQPTKASTPEAVKEPSHTRAHRHMWHKENEREKAGAPPQVEKILTTCCALI